MMESILAELLFVGVCGVIGVSAIKMRRLARESRMTSFLFVDKGGPFDFKLVDIRSPMDVALSEICLEEEGKEMKKRGRLNDLFHFLAVITPLLFIFIGLVLSS